MKIKSIKLIVAATICMLSCSGFALAPVFADGEGGITTNSITGDIDACNNLTPGSVAYNAHGCGGGDTDKLPSTIQGILNVIIGVSGLVAAIFIVIGGVNYMTSTGEPTKTKKAKDTILYACIGLIVCALAFAIVNWTISTINSANNSGGGTQASETEDDGGDE